ncbi:MAG: DMT family transporter [Paracoccaceae bacterium]
MPVTRYRTGVILVLAAGLLWSVMGLALRHIHTADTWQILFYRSLGMVPVLLAFIAWRSGGSPWPRLRRAGWAGVIGGLGLVLAFAGAIYAIQTTTVANAVFLFAASPFFTAVLSRLVLGETVRRATWMSIAIAAVGMLIMVREGLAAGELAGNLAALASAMGFTGFTLALRWSTLEETTPAVALGGIFAVLVAAAVCLFRGTGLVVPLPDAGIAFGMGAMVLSGGMICYTPGGRVDPRPWS